MSMSMRVRAGLKVMYCRLVSRQSCTSCLYVVNLIDVCTTTYVHEWHLCTIKTPVPGSLAVVRGFIASFLSSAF